MEKRRQRVVQCGVIAAWFLLVSGACGTSTEPTPTAPGIPDPVQVDPPEPSLTRITQAQYGHAIVDLLGPDIAVPTSLEPDVALKHLIAIGSSSTTISPRGAEKYEEAARSVARQVVENEALRQSLTLCESMREWPACYEKFAVNFGRRVWRRPISAEEADILVGLATQAQQALGLSEAGSVVKDDYYLGIEMMLSAFFQSPHFLYRVELGEPLPDDPTHRRVTPYEMASRLSFFFWNSGSEIQMSQPGLLRSVLHQILSKRPSLIPVVFPARLESCILFGDERAD